MRRPAAAAVLAAVVAAGSGSAAVPSTPSAVSTAFVQGYLTADPAACDLATPHMQQLFARLANGASCKAALAAVRAEADAVADKDARRALRETVQATPVLIDARAKASGKRRVWLGPHTPVVGERLVAVWQRGDEKGLCAELHQGLRRSASIFGEKCEVASEPRRRSG